MIFSPVNSTTSTNNAAANAGTSTANASDASAMQDRFLKLLVAQLNNQDPMNPLDNAQMTSQMAQINTVTGIQTLNLTMQTMAEQFSTMQTLQGTQMIGRSVLAEGDKLAYTDKLGKGQFDLAGSATSTKVEVVTPGGMVVGTVDMGALEKGRHDFEWDASQYAGNASDLKFRVVATTKEGAVTVTPLVAAKVTGTGTSNGALTLSLDSGATVNYSQIRAVL